MKPESTTVAKVANFRDSLSRSRDFGTAGTAREVVGSQVARLCLQAYGESLQAIVLTGSLARDEATLVEERKTWRLLGDAEFLLIFRPGAPLPPKAQTDFLRHNVENAVSRLGITGEISLVAAYPKYLRTLRQHIFAYELRAYGRVVGGDEEILAQIPNFSASDIPLEDGWCLLSNRIVEQVEALAGLEQGPRALPRHLFYRTVKLYLDMATSLLLFVGEYAPSYSEREQRLRTLAEKRHRDNRFPFDLRRFCDRVSECTRWKLAAVRLSSPQSALMDEFGFSWWEEAVDCARKLWRWELELLTPNRSELESRHLLHRWMRNQSLTRRLRGWLFVLREQGWHRSWRNWPRWTRLACGASPRYWVYSGASELFFQLPSAFMNSRQRADFRTNCEGILSHLPVLSHAAFDRKGSTRDNWRHTASAVAYNYGKFLKETRS